MKVLNKLREYIQRYRLKGFIRYVLLVFKPSFVTLKMREAKINYLDYKFLKRKFSYVIENYLNGEKSNKTVVCKKVIWSCWFQGKDAAPDIVQACWNSMKKYYPDYELIIITDDNMLEYVRLPEHVLKKYKNGIIGKTHLSDILRLELLTRYGGIWFDSTVFCTGTSMIDNIEQKNLELFVLNNAMRNNDAIAMSSWFLYAKSNNPILLCTKELLYEYWKKYNYLCNYFLMHLFFSITAEKMSEEWKKVPVYSNINAHLMQNELFCKYDSDRYKQLKEISDIHKLSYKFDKAEFEKNNTLYKHILKLDKL